MLVYAGVTPGSTFCPPLFLLYTNNFPYDSISNVAIFADDIAVHFTCKKLLGFRKKLNLASELESDLLGFNTWKNQLFSFDWSSNCASIGVKMSKSSLDEKSSFKLMGLAFSSDVSCLYC